MKTQLNTYSKGGYSPGASKLKIILWLCLNSLILKNSLNLSSGVKKLILKIFGAKIGDGVILKQSLSIKYPWFLSIGDHTWIGENVWIDNLVDVKIGSHVCLSQGAMILTGNHDYKKETFDLITQEVILEDGVWIGAKSIVCPGVICKSHSVLTVGSVAVGDLEEYSVYQGNPAVKIRERTVGILNSKLGE